MTLPLCQQVPKRGGSRTDEHSLKSPAPTGVSGVRVEVRPLRARGKAEAKINRRSIRRTLVIADIGLSSSTETGLELILGRHQTGDHRVVGVAAE